MWNSRPGRTLDTRGAWEGTYQPWFDELGFAKKTKRGMDGSQVWRSVRGYGDYRLISEVGLSDFT